MGKRLRSLGLLLLSYSLVGCGFKSDMEDVCHAVKRSGVGISRSKEELVTALLWARARVRTEEGRAFWQDFEATEAHNRYYYLRMNSWEAGVEDYCPMDDEIRAMPLPRLITLDRWPKPPTPASPSQDAGGQAAEDKPEAGRVTR